MIANQFPDRRLTVGLMIFALIALMALACAGCADPAADGSQTALPARPVKAITLTLAPLDEARTFPGIVRAGRQIDLAFRVGGPLVAFDVRAGQNLKQGDVIAGIDPRDFKVQLQRLSAALAEAKAALKAMRKGARAEDIARLKAELAAALARMTNAQTDFQRQQNLLAEQAASQSQYDHARTAFDTARAGVEALQQELKKARSGARSEDIEAAEAGIQRLLADLAAAKNALADTTLTAPVDGYIDRKYVENYETVAPGRPVVSLLDVSTMELKTAVPEDIMIRQADIAALACLLDAYPGQSLPGVLKEIGPQTDTANQSYPLTVDLDVPEGLEVTPGMAATLHITLKKEGQPPAGFLLPATAVFADTQGNSCVWRIDPATRSVARTPVTTGRLTGDTVQITGGLEAADQVVTAGARFLRDGQPVRVLGADQEAAS